MALGWLRRRTRDEPPGAARSLEWPWWFSFNSNQYPYGVSYTQPGQEREKIDPTYTGYVRASFRSSAIVFACMEVRRALFSEARFQFRQRRTGRPGQLFGTEELRVLERPWQHATTGDLLARAIQAVDLAGNFYARRVGDQLQLLRPDWVTIVFGSRSDPEHAGYAIDSEIVGYLYQPGGPGSGAEPVSIPVEQMCHFAPIPDPEARFRGMSWLTPLLRELQADNAMTEHKLQFFENAATPNLAVMLDVSDPDRFQKWEDKIRAKFAGVSNAYETLVLGAGAQIVPVGTDLKQLDFKVTQGAGETRIAAAASVPPVIVGLSEGLEAATYSNYALAMRRFADLTLRPLWRNIAGSLEHVIDVPGGAELWYDDRDIAALKDDIVSRAEVQAKQGAAAKLMFDAGYLPESIVEWLNADDITRLSHSGLTSVQTQGSNNGGGEMQALPPASRALLEELEAVVEGGG